MPNTTTPYLSTTQRSALIREALKAKGIPARAVSVRSDHFSMGSAIRIVIKSAAVRISLVKEIASEHEKIDRCSSTGEILSGGNRYLDVEYGHDLVRGLAAGIESKLSDEEGVTVRVGSWEVHRADRYDYIARNTATGREIRSYMKDGAARNLVVAMLDAGELS
jgi:hypothetical protein